MISSILIENLDLHSLNNYQNKLAKHAWAEECLPVTCRMFCPDGWAQDSHGCDICVCAPPARDAVEKKSKKQYKSELTCPRMFIVVQECKI